MDAEDFRPSDLAALRPELEESIAQARRGEAVSYEEILQLFDAALARLDKADTSGLSAAE